MRRHRVAKSDLIRHDLFFWRQEVFYLVPRQLYQVIVVVAVDSGLDSICTKVMKQSTNDSFLKVV